MILLNPYFCFPFWRGFLLERYGPSCSSDAVALAVEFSFPPPEDPFLLVLCVLALDGFASSSLFISLFTIVLTVVVFIPVNADNFLRDMPGFALTAAATASMFSGVLTVGLRAVYDAFLTAFPVLRNRCAQLRISLVDGTLL